MKSICLILIVLTFSSCGNRKTNENNTVTNGFSTTINQAEKETSVEETIQSFDCKCIDYHFSQANEDPILINEIDSISFLICGYKGVTDYNLQIGKLREDSSFYVRGFNIFICTDSEIMPLYEDSEYYINLIKPGINQLVVNRVIRMPTGKGIEYDWKEITSLRFYYSNGEIKRDKYFIMSTEHYNDEFLKFFHKTIEYEKNDPTISGNYYEHLIDYYFIQAIKEPIKYENKLKNLGPFDGYLGPIYRDILEYYELFKKTK